MTREFTVLAEAIEQVAITWQGTYHDAFRFVCNEIALAITIPWDPSSIFSRGGIR